MMKIPIHILKSIEKLKKEIIHILFNKLVKKNN
jgi:hypothetical protein